MALISIRCDGFDLLMHFDPTDDDDMEIMAEAFLLLHRRAEKFKEDKGNG